MVWLGSRGQALGRYCRPVQTPHHVHTSTTSLHVTEFIGTACQFTFSHAVTQAIIADYKQHPYHLTAEGTSLKQHERLHLQAQSSTHTHTADSSAQCSVLLDCTESV